VTDPEKPAPPKLPMDEAAAAYARRFNLVTEDGQIVCILGCGQLAQLPSLCCWACLEARRK
jgi:hypothetical protein